MSDNSTKWHEPTSQEEEIAPRVNGLTFWEALWSAVGCVETRGEGATTADLADYLDSDTPLAQNDRYLLADFLRMLPDRHPRGHPFGAAPGRWRNDVRKAARRVDREKKRWCKLHRRSRVPKLKIEEFVDAETADRVTQQAILNALKSKRF